MGVDFRWEAGEPADEWPVLPEPAPRRRRDWRWLLIPLVIVLALGGAVAWRARDGERAAREDLQRVVEQEVAALKAGQLEVLSALLSGSPLYWRRYHAASFYRESAWYAARGTASVRVEQVRLEPGRAEVVVALDDGQQTRRGTWHYIRVGEQWRHAPPPPDSWGEIRTLGTPQVAASARTQGLDVAAVMVELQAGLLDSGEQSRPAPARPDPWAETRTVRIPRVTVRARTPDLDLAAGLASEVEALYRRLVEVWGLASLPAGLPASTAQPALSHIAIEVTPNVSSIEWESSSPGKGEGRLDVRIPSPQLALELWTVEEQKAYLGRAARTAVAQQVVYGAMWGANGESPWVVVQGLIFWHARAWEPEWDGYLQAGLADGTAERFLVILDGDLEAERFLDDLSAGAGSPEEAILRLLPLTHCLGELLGTRYPAEELLPFLRNAGRHDTIWGAFEAELGLSRVELEEAWRAHLRERAGAGVTNP